MDYVEFYRKYLPDIKKAYGHEWKARCCFHEDDKPSLFINDQTGLFHCWGCNKSGGALNFESLLGVESTVDSKEHPRISREVSINKPISNKLVEQYHKNLLDDPWKMMYLLRSRKLTYFTIKKYLIGYDTSSDRYAIPIKTSTGEFCNIKLHNSSLVPKALYFQKGHLKLYPVSSLQKSSIVICEGELDALALLSAGINAISSTSGSQSWAPNWNQKFLGKDIKILYDSDEAGKIGAENVFENLTPYTNTVKIISFTNEDIIEVNKKLERDKDTKIDVTDYLVVGMDINRLLKIRKNL